MQRPGRHQHQPALAEHGGERIHQHLPECLRRGSRSGQRGLPLSGGLPAAGEPSQREAQPLQLLDGRLQWSELMPAEPPVDQGERGERAVVLEQLHQRRRAECARELAAVHGRCVGVRSGGAVAGEAPDRCFECGLASDERSRGAARLLRSPDLGADPAQVGLAGSERRGVGRHHRSQP